MPRPKKVEAEIPIEETETEAVPNETKAEKFTRIAKLRMGNALYHINNLGKLASPNYEFTPEQVDKMIAALKIAISEVEDRYDAALNKSAAKGKPTFDF